MPANQPASAASNAPIRVLVVDDEEAICELVATTLRYEGYDVAVAMSGMEAIALVQSFHPSVAILDVMLGDIDGFELMRRLRTAGEEVSVLFLTAVDSPEDRVRGLTIGADDYICKPFSLAELVARVKVVLRRSSRTSEPSILRVADLEMNLDTLEVRRGADHIDFTPTEFKLLRYLMENANRVLSKDQIVDRVWQYDFDGDTNIVETYVSYLRKKIDADRPPLLQTVRGFGYSLRTPRQ